MTNRSFERPFTLTISGTILVDAVDEGRANDSALPQLRDITPESLWGNAGPQLKDGLRSSLNLGNAAPSAKDQEDEKRRQEGIEEGSPAPQRDPVPLTDFQKSEAAKSATNTTEGAHNPAIGMSGTKEPLRSEQPTGAPTTAKTSAGAVAPSVNRSTSPAQPQSAKPPLSPSKK